MQKTQQKIIERIKLIEDDLFDEDTIKLLLIEIREFLKHETFLKEICHFVAHPERDSGICHKKIDSRYAKLKFIEENTKKVLTPEFIETNKDKPESFFMDAILGYIKTDKIDEQIFKLLIIGGIEDIDNNLFLKHYNLNKKRVKDLISKSYFLHNKEYQIQPSLSDMEWRRMDSLLKFIRGTITGKPAFSQEEIFNDFIRALKKLGSDIGYICDTKKIKVQEKNIIVCILAILHDSKFKLFDNTFGSGVLSVHPKDSNEVLCLMSNSGKTTIPLIMTKIKGLDFIATTIDQLRKYEFEELPWNRCVRDKNGALILAKA
jgi:hypothetical protein